MRLKTNDWNKQTNHIVSQLFANCAATTGRVSYRGQSKVIVLVQTTRDDYEGCLLAVINGLEGHMMRWRPVENRKSEGRMWEYTLVFMRDPLDTPSLEKDEENE